MSWRRKCVVATRLRQNTRLINVEHLMSDQQGREAPASEFESGAEEVRQVILPGAQLAAQRQAKGWSVEHAASHLKFATRQVVALEADNYAALPGPVIVRGFVRAYAKLLGLDANALVASLPQEGATQKEAIVPQRTLSTPFSESPLPLGNRSKVPPGLIVGGVLVVVLAAAAFAIHRTDVFNDVPQLSWLKPGSTPAVAEEHGATPSETQDLPPEVQDGSDKSKPEKAESTVASAASSAITTISEHVASVVSTPSPAPAPDVSAPVVPNPVKPVAPIVSAPPAPASVAASTAAPAVTSVA